MTGNGARAPIWTRESTAAVLGMSAAAAVALDWMGRRLWCRAGGWSPWSWDIWSEHNSQHLLDPYTFTHVLHGLLFYGFLWAVFRGRFPALCVVFALAVEALWEVGENTNTVIEAYRETTISLNYYGDSILNSLADIAAFALGYTAARHVPAWVSVASFVAVELALLLTIRDSLVLNVIMLIAPQDAILAWQTAGAPTP